MTARCLFLGHSYTPILRGIYIDGGAQQIDIKRCVRCGKLIVERNHG